MVCGARSVDFAGASLCAFGALRLVIGAYVASALLSLLLWTGQSDEQMYKSRGWTDTDLYLAWLFKAQRDASNHQFCCDTGTSNTGSARCAAILVEEFWLS